MTLIERICAAEAGSRELDGRLAVTFGRVPPFVRTRYGPDMCDWSGGRDQWSAPQYTASIDVALSLLPIGRDWELDNFGGNLGRKSVAKICMGYDWVTGTASTPALAIGAAAIQARSA